VETKRIIVGITGASGPHYGVRLVEVLREQTGVEIHLVISRGGVETMRYELSREVRSVASLAHQMYEEGDLAAAIASGTFLTDGMVIAPCSIKTLGQLANSLNDNLIVRAADVCLKERRPVVLVVRETPLHLGHLRLMERVTEAGAVVLPPVPAFYHRPITVDEIVNHTVVKILDQFKIHVDLIERWAGVPRGEA
jgi:4-hydroxy-3-polyprenylbenzoate decarboxylase